MSSATTFPAQGRAPGAETGALLQAAAGVAIFALGLWALVADLEAWNAVGTPAWYATSSSGRRYPRARGRSSSGAQRRSSSR